MRTIEEIKIEGGIRSRAGMYIRYLRPSVTKTGHREISYTSVVVGPSKRRKVGVMIKTFELGNESSIRMRESKKESLRHSWWLFGE